MRAVFAGGHLITKEQTRLGKLFAHDYFGELGVLVQEWPGIPFRRTRSARIVSKVALLCILTYRDLHNLCQSSYQLHIRVQRHIAELKKNQPAMFQPKSLHADAKQPESVAVPAMPASSAQLDVLSAKVDGMERDLTEIKQMLRKVVQNSSNE